MLTAAQLYPAEVFPTKFKSTAHGLSAACGKGGAIISALAFNTLSNHVGTPVVLWSACPLPSVRRLALTQRTVFFGCCVAGAIVTLLLPEVKGRDADLVYAEELREAAAARR